MHYERPGFPPGANLFGIPPGVSDQVGLQLYIVHPQGKAEGSIELVANPGAQGLDLAVAAAPPNFGMAVLRFPVKGLDALAAHLQARGVEPAMEPTTLTLAPWGTVRLLALRAPDGAWLEFVEPAV